MNSLIEHVLSLKDNKEALTMIWCDFHVFLYPESLPQEYKPDWWEMYSPIESNNSFSHKYDRDQFIRWEGKRETFSDAIDAYIETIIPKNELHEAFKVYMKQVHNYDGGLLQL